MNGDGITNFTDVAATFSGIIRDLKGEVIAINLVVGVWP